MSKIGLIGGKGSSSAFRLTRVQAVLAMAFVLSFLPRVLIAPYTGHGYDLRIFTTWLLRSVELGPFIYVSPEGMFGPEWGGWGQHPNFVIMPPVYPLSLFLAGRVYAYLRPSLNDPYLLVLSMKLPQIVAECLLVSLICYIVSEKTGIKRGILAAAMFSANPLCFFFTAIFGIPDPLVALFAVSSLYCVTKGRFFTASCLLGVSLAVKPYSLIFMLPLLLFALRDFSPLKTSLPVVSAATVGIISSPWLIAQGPVFVEAMLVGGGHHMGRHLWRGTPSFWQLIQALSGELYGTIATYEFQLGVFLFLAALLSILVQWRGVNRDRSNVWFFGFLSLFCFMMFMPSVHEKWIYTCFPLLTLATFLSPHEHLKMSSIYLLSVLTFTFFAIMLRGPAVDNGDYYFTCAEVLPARRDFTIGGPLGESIYHASRSYVNALEGTFAGFQFHIFSFMNVILLALSPPLYFTRRAENG